MEEQKESTKAKLKVVTSRTEASRQASIAEQSTGDGAKLRTEAKAEAEKMRNMLARMIDVTHNWACKLPSGKMPAPHIANGFIIFAFPVGCHVIQNAVTSTGGQNFIVDNEPVIPVTSEDK